MQKRACYAIARQVISSVMDTNGLAMNLVSGTYYMFDVTASLIWKYLETLPSKTQIHAYVETNFETDNIDVMHRSVDDFIVSLISESLVTEATTSTPESPIAPAEAKLPFTPPLFTSFTDLQNMLINPLIPETYLHPAHADIVSEQYDDEVVVLNLGVGIYYSLRGSAAVIWSYIRQGTTFREVLTALTLHYSDLGDEFQDTSHSFIQYLRDEGLITFVSSGTSQATQAQNASPRAKTAFAAPTAEKFTDLQDMLRLDPVHDVEPGGWPLEAQS